MELEIEFVTVNMAKKYLQYNTQNRPLRKSLVSQYARDMENGRWKLTHQGIAFNCDGTLLDGQHRLAAIIESGIAVQMLVARGIENQNQLVMDDHAKRSAGDAIGLIRSKAVHHREIAFIRGAIELSQGRRIRLTKQELNEVFDKFKLPLAFVKEHMAKSERGIGAAAVQSAIVLAWYYVKDLDRLKSFCKILSGMELPENNNDRAAVVLREWLLKNGMQFKYQRLEGFKKTQRAIEAFVKYNGIEKLYGTNIYYPYPLVDPVR